MNTVCYFDEDYDDDDDDDDDTSSAEAPYRDVSSSSCSSVSLQNVASSALAECQLDKDDNADNAASRMDLSTANTSSSPLQLLTVIPVLNNASIDDVSNQSIANHSISNTVQLPFATLALNDVTEGHSNPASQISQHAAVDKSDCDIDSCWSETDGILHRSTKVVHDIHHMGRDFDRLSNGSSASQCDADNTVSNILTQSAAQLTDQHQLLSLADVSTSIECHSTSADATCAVNLPLVEDGLSSASVTDDDNDDNNDNDDNDDARGPLLEVTSSMIGNTTNGVAAKGESYSYSYQSMPVCLFIYLVSV